MHEFSLRQTLIFLVSILWEPCTEKSDSLLALDESSIRLLRLGEGYSTAQVGSCQARSQALIESFTPFTDT